MYNNKILIDRSLMLKKARSFLESLGCIEVDVPSLSKKASIDLHIEVMQTNPIDNEKGFLHTSPEYLMKRLLSLGLKDIYYLGHVFRKDELGPIHNPEFTMAEWYRSNISYHNFLSEILGLISIFLPNLPHTKLSYRDTFYKYTNIDYLNISQEKLFAFAKKHIDINEMWDKDTLLNLILSHLIEPHLGQNEIFILDNYPASQAALAKIKKVNDESVACRFEFYFEGIELANGFHELSSSSEQKERFHIINKQRKEANKEVLELDHNFINSLDNIGDCFGVALGFDRLFMLKHKKKFLKEILPFAWEEI